MDKREQLRLSDRLRRCINDYIPLHTSRDTLHKGTDPMDERSLGGGMSVSTLVRDIVQIEGSELNVGSISTADGSALVRIGETTMLCGIKAEIAEPNLATPDEGHVGRYSHGAD